MIFKEMNTLYDEYLKYVQNKKNKNKKNENNEKNIFELNEKNKLRSKHFFTDNEIFEKLQILLAYLKQNNIKIDQKQFLRPLLLDYNKVIEREEYLKKLDKEYQKFIEKKKEEEKKEKSRNNNINYSKYPIDERTEKEKIVNIYSYHKINTEHSNTKNNENNYFLTAYKNIFDEKNNRKSKKEIPIIVTERSINPYGTYDKLKNNNKTEEIRKIENNVYNKKLREKRPNSSYGSRQVKITYYHPGSFFLFKEKDKEYYAWSCCLNEDKFSKGCSKKFERVLNFTYKDEI